MVYTLYDTGQKTFTMGLRVSSEQKFTKTIFREKKFRENYKCCCCNN